MAGKHAHGAGILAVCGSVQLWSIVQEYCVLDVVIVSVGGQVQLQHLSF